MMPWITVTYPVTNLNHMFWIVLLESQPKVEPMWKTFETNWELTRYDEEE